MSETLPRPIKITRSRRLPAGATMLNVCPLLPIKRLARIARESAPSNDLFSFTPEGHKSRVANTPTTTIPVRGNPGLAKESFIKSSLQKG